jgi:hypothetical protein
VICRASRACDFGTAVAEMVFRPGLLPYKRVCSLLTRGHHLGRMAKCGSAGSASDKGGDVVVGRGLARCPRGRTFVHHVQIDEMADK